MKTTLLLLLLILSAEAFAQDKPRAIQSVRVAVEAPDNEVNRAMVAALRDELRKLPDRDVAIVSGKSHFAIKLNAAPMIGKCDGFAVAVVVEGADGSDLSAYSGPTLRDVAAYIAATVNRTHFARRRARAGD